MNILLKDKLRAEKKEFLALHDSKKKDKVFFIISDVDNRRWLLIFFEWVGRPWKKII